MFNFYPENLTDNSFTLGEIVSLCEYSFTKGEIVSLCEYSNG